MNIQQVRQQAQDEHTSSAILEKLATNKDKLTRQYVASNPNTPVEILEKLGEEFPNEITANPIFDLLLLENPDSQFVRVSLARSSTTSLKTLEKLLNSSYQNVNTNRENGNDTTILVALGNNQNLLPRMLDKLVNHPNLYVRRNMALNYYTSREILKRFSLDQSDEVRSAVALNRNTSREIIERLSVDQSENVRRIVALNRYTSREIIERLSVDQSEKVRAAVATRRNTSREIIERLSLDQSEEVRQAVAGNENISLEIIQKLLKDKNQFVRAVAKENLDKRKKNQVV